MARRRIPTDPVGPLDPDAGSSADDIARLAGVSRSTVSRALSGSSCIAASTRQRVLEVAKALRHRPNVLGRALRTGRTHTIGIAMPPWASDFYGRMLMQLYKTVAAQGLNVSISIWNPQEPQEPWFAKVLQSGHFDVLVAHYEFARNNAAFDALNASKTPVVLLNHIPGRTDRLRASSVAMDDRRGIRQAVRHLVSLGHKDIRFVGGGLEEYFDATRRLQGFRDGMKEAGLPVTESAVLPCKDGFAASSGSKAVQLLLSQGKRRPTALVCVNDNTALGAMRALKQCGLNVPVDVSVTGFDNTQWSEFCTPALTTITHDGVMLGQAAAELAIRYFNNPDAEPQSILLPSTLVVRESTAARRARRA